MNWYKALKEHIINGDDISLIGVTPSLDQMDKAIEQIEKNPDKDQQINILYNKRIYNIKLTQKNYGLDQNAPIWKILYKIQKNPNFEFQLLAKENILKVSENFYIIGNGIEKININFINEVTNEVINVIGDGINIVEPFKINLIYKYNQNKDFAFNYIENPSDYILKYVKENIIKYIPINTIKTSDLAHITQQSQISLSNLNHSEQTNEIKNNNNVNNEVEQVSNIDDLFKSFATTKKERKKVKL